MIRIVVLTTLPILILMFNAPTSFIAAFAVATAIGTTGVLVCCCRF